MDKNKKYKRYSPSGLRIFDLIRRNLINERVYFEVNRASGQLISGRPYRIRDVTERDGSIYLKIEYIDTKDLSGKRLDDALNDEESYIRRYRKTTRKWNKTPAFYLEEVL